ncbi:MAG: hypothetical protein L0Z50_15470 [Verrucomicrobiales bacterium]|nr:hypothetical protein [Verrucomicrobiales bacterium]
MPNWVVRERLLVCVAETTQSLVLKFSVREWINMYPRVCICCGQAMMSRVASYNPSLCGGCAEADWNEEQVVELGRVPLLAEPSASATTHISEEHRERQLKDGPYHWDHFDDAAEPSAIDLLEAEIAAKRILAETAAKEAMALEQRLFDLKHLTLQS